MSKTIKNEVPTISVYLKSPFNGDENRITKFDYPAHYTIEMNNQSGYITILDENGCMMCLIPIENLYFIASESHARFQVIDVCQLREVTAE